MARPHIVWTEEMIDILISDYPITFDDVLAEKLGVSISTLRRKAAELKLSKAGTGKMNYKTWETVERLFPTHSHRQIALAAHVSERTVRRICRALHLKRDKDEDAVMRSEGMMRIYRSENRRMVFGLDQRLNRCLGKDTARLKIYDELRRYGYIVIKGCRTVYYSAEMRRVQHVESYAVALGLVFEQWNAE